MLEKGTTEDKMVGWYHQLNGHEFEQTLGDSEGQGSLACCSPWSHKELDVTERPNNNRGMKKGFPLIHLESSPGLGSESAES